MLAVTAYVFFVGSPNKSVGGRSYSQEEVVAAADRALSVGTDLLDNIFEESIYSAYTQSYVNTCVTGGETTWKYDRYVDFACNTSIRRAYQLEDSFEEVMKVISNNIQDQGYTSNWGFEEKISAYDRFTRYFLPEDYDSSTPEWTASDADYRTLRLRVCRGAFNGHSESPEPGVNYKKRSCGDAPLAYPAVTQQKLLTQNESFDQEIMETITTSTNDVLWVSYEFFDQTTP